MAPQPVPDEFDTFDELSSSSSRKPMVKVIAMVVVAALLVNWFWPEFAIRHAEGILVDQEPWQGPPPDAMSTVWSHNGYTFTSLAEITLEARVLHKKRYRFGRESDVSSYDLALGWNQMSDQYVVDRLNFSQRGRWYYFSYKQPAPVSPNIMLNNSGNFHTVAANDEVQEIIASLRPGHLIYLSGQLVRINSNDGFNWQSSLTRTDRGNGSCELIWVEDIVIISEGQ